MKRSVAGSPRTPVTVHVPVAPPQGTPEAAGKALTPRVTQGPQAPLLMTDALRTATVETPRPPATLPARPLAGANAPRMAANRPPPVDLIEEAPAEGIRPLTYEPDADAAQMQARQHKVPGRLRHHFDGEFNVAQNLRHNKLQMIDQEISRMHDFKSWEFLFKDTPRLLSELVACKNALVPTILRPVFLKTLSNEQLETVQTDIEACLQLLQRLHTEARSLGQAACAGRSANTKAIVDQQFAWLDAKAIAYTRQWSAQHVDVQVQRLHRLQLQNTSTGVMPAPTEQK